MFTVSREPGAEDVSALFLLATLTIGTKDTPQASSHGPGHTDPGAEAMLCTHPTHVLLQDTEMWDSCDWIRTVGCGVSDEGGFRPGPEKSPICWPDAEAPVGD